ncbi:flagellar biosynthetic protein FliO [Romboutsia sedimentorum]|uniref:flagellar biosynthetic protein FliO n=1 Tax=Romboutsia sedimentorum TaxID=1368474 RepID=UPI0024DF02B9|nr:flagellar biosynthetic protein FliO [Romboutsia sedimentorum]MDK2585846.1 flagellar biosynthetic protein FliO [Romboutsia sedimentorum]
MDNILQYIINLIVFVPFIIVLIVVSIKFSKINLSNMTMNKYTQIIERTNLNKDTEVFVLKIGDEGCVLVSSPSKIEKIKELNKYEILEIENNKKENRKKKLSKFSKNELGLKKLELSELQLKKLEFKKLQLKKVELNKLQLKKIMFRENEHGDSN